MKDPQDVPSLPAMAKADIMGLSCRLPESENAAAFWDNLINQRDMVTANDKRWPVRNLWPASTDWQSPRLRKL